MFRGCSEGNDLSAPLDDASPSRSISLVRSRSESDTPFERSRMPDPNVRPRSSSSCPLPADETSSSDAISSPTPRVVGVESGWCSSPCTSRTWLPPPNLKIDSRYFLKWRC